MFKIAAVAFILVEWIVVVMEQLIVVGRIIMISVMGVLILVRPAKLLALVRRLMVRVLLRPAMVVAARFALLKLFKSTKWLPSDGNIAWWSGLMGKYATQAD